MSLDKGDATQVAEAERLSMANLRHLLTTGDDAAKHAAQTMIMDKVRTHGTLAGKKARERAIRSIDRRRGRRWPRAGRALRVSSQGPERAR